MSKYSGLEDHDILVIVADSTDRQEQHLLRINGTIANHEKRIMKQELRREVEEEIGIKPRCMKKKLAEGGLYGGSGALIISIIYGLGHLIGWW